MRQNACQEFFSGPFFGVLKEIDLGFGVWYILKYNKTIIHLSVGEFAGYVTGRSIAR